jgi:predicted MFS family arabinose efflux permease
VLVAPLGDLLERRALVVRLLGVCALALVAVTLVASFWALAVAFAVMGFATSAVQVLMPFAGVLAAPHERGRVMGAVLAGALTGMLLARTVSGYSAGQFGWRAPFAIGACTIVVLAVVVWRTLPHVAPTSRMSYPQLLLSVVRLVRTYPLLRRRMVYGACGVASFGMVWTAIAFLLAGDPYGFDEQTIGLFGLAGVLGALGAQRFGVFADRGWVRRVTGLTFAAMVLSWAILGFGATSIVAILMGLALIDFAIHGQNVLSHTILIALDPEQAGRFATVFVTTTFVGGALGSALGAVAWSLGGWSAVCIAGAAIATCGGLAWLTELRSGDR